LTQQFKRRINADRQFVEQQRREILERQLRDRLGVIDEFHRTRRAAGKAARTERGDGCRTEGADSGNSRTDGAAISAAASDIQNDDFWFLQ
jgi:hypothetical protein